MKDKKMARIQDIAKKELLKKGMPEKEWDTFEWAFKGDLFFEGDKQVSSEGVITTKLKTKRCKPTVEESTTALWGNQNWVFSGVVYFVGDEQVGHGGDVAIVFEPISNPD